MSDKDLDENGTGRRHALECMIWAGTGVLWTVSGGVPRSLSLLGAAETATVGPNDFTFLQISDSHIGFDKPANPHAVDTLQEPIDSIKALTVKPAFMLHTGDITHLSKRDQFDTAQQLIGSTGIDVHYVPGEHDIVDEGMGAAYMQRYGKGTQGNGWYSYDQNGVHFVGLVNVAGMKADGLGVLGPDQLTWLEADLKPLAASTPIVVFAHIPLWLVYPSWGWGTDDAAVTLGYRLTPPRTVQGPEGRVRGRPPGKTAARRQWPRAACRHPPWQSTRHRARTGRRVRSSPASRVRTPVHRR